MIKKKEREERGMLEVEAEKQRQRYDAKSVLKKQMDEKAEKEKEAYEQYLREKEQVEKVMQTLLNSELREMENKDQKKKKAFLDMKEALVLKEQQRQTEEELLLQEEARYLAYVKELDSREEAVKQERFEKEEIKNKIFERLKVEEEKRRHDADELDSLRRELYQEEYEAQIQRKEHDEM